MGTSTQGLARLWSRVGICLLQSCAGLATQWGFPYNRQFWQDWRTDVRLSHLDRELVGLLASAHADGSFGEPMT